jgi:5-methylcytosine-specific restriction endonuclease McrA
MLERGFSLAEIGRRVDRHESTVAYWVAKHGLTAVGRSKYAARGGISPELLASLVEKGLSAEQIGQQVGLSKTTVRHWLKEHGLTTQWADRKRTSTVGQQRTELRCPKHGLTTFIPRADSGYRCARCRSEAVSRRRRRVKAILVEEGGGRCAVCGYDRCAAALEFHHLVPAEKSFSLSHRGVARSLEKARAEASKCVLLCANCHAEVEVGIAVLA